MNKNVRRRNEHKVFDFTFGSMTFGTQNWETLGIIY